MEQALAQLLLQPTDLLAHSGLCSPDPLGGEGEASLFNNSKETFEKSSIKHDRFIYKTTHKGVNNLFCHYRGITRKVSHVRSRMG